MTQNTPALIPEFSVTDIAASLTFYVDTLGWRVIYDRPEQGFAMLGLYGARLMLDQLALGRDFDPALTAADRPFGRGTNLKITIPEVALLLAALDHVGIALHMPTEDAWYRVSNQEIGQRQFVVADPDGYLLRFAQPLGRRPAQGG